MMLDKKGSGGAREEFGPESLSDGFDVGDDLSFFIRLIGAGERRWSLAGEQDQCAVGSDVIGAGVVRSSCSPSVAVFVPVVRSACGPGIGLVGAATCRVRFVVVDFAAIG